MVTTADLWGVAIGIALALIILLIIRRKMKGGIKEYENVTTPVKENWKPDEDDSSNGDDASTTTTTSSSRGSKSNRVVGERTDTPEGTSGVSGDEQHNRDEVSLPRSSTSKSNKRVFKWNK